MSATSESSNPAPSASSVTACFTVAARAEPGVMPRVLELFAKRGLIPSQWHSALVGADRDELHIDIQLENVSRELAGFIALSLRQLIDVEIVLTSEKHFVRSR
jgi:acetolactate synthase small subunit